MMTVTTFWPKEINFRPISTNGGSIHFPYTTLVPTDRIVSKTFNSNGSFVSEEHARVR